MKLSKQKARRRSALEAGTAVLVALGLDILGEPPASWHPVAWYGKCIQRLEQAAPHDHLAQLLYGGVMLLLASPTALLPLDTTRRQQVVVLRSLTKDFALAVLRLGYAVAAPDVTERLGAQLPSWNVNGVAQEAAIAALTDRTHLKTTLDLLATERLAFFHALRDIGLHLIPSRTHFCLIEVGDAHHVRQQLLNRKILVRDCTSFGLPQFVRVATRPASEWQQLLFALEEII